MDHLDWVQMEDFSKAFSVARKRRPETTANEADTFYFLPCGRGFLRWLRLCVPSTPHRRKGGTLRLAIADSVAILEHNP
jgi:hypothetical protein